MWVLSKLDYGMRGDFAEKEFASQLADETYTQCNEVDGMDNVHTSEFPGSQAGAVPAPDSSPDDFKGTQSSVGRSTFPTPSVLFYT